MSSLTVSVFLLSLARVCFFILKAPWVFSLLDWWAPHLPLPLLKNQLTVVGLTCEKQDVYTVHNSEGLGINIYLETIPNFKPIDMSITSQSFPAAPFNAIVVVIVFHVIKTFNIGSKIYPLNKFEVYNAVLLTIGTVLCSNSPEFI